MTLAIAVVTVHDNPTPSMFYPVDEQSRNAAMDYHVTVDLPSDALGPRSFDSSITLYRDHVGRMSACGSPMDGWVGGDLVRWIRTRSDREAADILGALQCGPGESEIEIEI